jgi:GntR family transcriptional regulator, phosphonate transport system regulatory protein
LRQSGVVLWKKLAEKLENEIGAGEIAAGTRLPPEPELAARFGVNRHTIRRAVAALADMGLVSIEQGRGTFVRGTGMLGYPIGPRTRFTDVISGLNQFPRARFIRSARVPAMGKMATDLKLQEGDLCLLLETLHLADERPINLAAHYFPLARFEGLDRVFQEVGSITKALTRFEIHDYTRRTTRVSSRMPLSGEAELLQQPIGKPVLVLETVNVDETGTPIEFGIGRFASEAVQLVFET